MYSFTRRSAVKKRKRKMIKMTVVNFDDKVVVEDGFMLVQVSLPCMALS